MEPYSLDQMQVALEHIENNTYLYHFFLNILSVVINIFHLIVITRKPMRTSSVNVLMIGIAVCDLFTMLTWIYKYLHLVDYENPECTTSNSLLKIYMDITAWSLLYHFRRCSCWIGILMASVRYVILSKSTDVRHLKLAQPKIGFLLISIVFITSGIITIVWQYECQVLEYRDYPLPFNCAEHQDINNPPRFSVTLRPVFNIPSHMINIGYFILDSTLSFLIPSIALPTFTILLIRKIREIKKASTINRVEENEEKYGMTEKLIIVIAISFFVAEAQLGIIAAFKTFIERTNKLFRISTDLTVYFTILATINSILHPTFCLLMSSQYRKTIKSFFKKKSEPSVAAFEFKMSSVVPTPITLH